MESSKKYQTDDKLKCVSVLLKHHCQRSTTLSTETLNISNMRHFVLTFRSKWHYYISEPFEYLKNLTYSTLFPHPSSVAPDTISIAVVTK